MAKKFLTLDIGAANVVLAEYEADGKAAPKLLRYGTAALSAPLEGGDAATILAPALMEIVREKGIRPGPVGISVSGQMAFQKFAALPPASGEKFEQQVRFEIEQNVPFPIDEMICDRQTLGETSAGDMNVMIVAAKTEQIEAITDAVASAGFTPTLVDVAPIALVNAAKAAVPDDGACDIFLDIGAKTTTLVISEGDKLYNRSIPIAGATLTREIASALGCTQEEAEQVKLERGYVSLGGVVEDEDEVADRVSKVCRAVMTRLNAEISRSVNFYRSQQGGSAPSRLYLTGGTALLGQLDQFFAESLQIEVVYFDPFAAASFGPAVDADALASDGAFLAPTAGLALHLAGAAHFAVNLLPPSLISLRAERSRVPVVGTAAALFLVSLALFWFGGSRATEVAQAEEEAVEAAVGRVNAEKSRLDAAVKEVETAVAEADALKALLTARSAPAARLAAFRQALPAGTWIHRWEGGKVIVRGWHDRLEAYVKAAAAKNGGELKTAPELIVGSLRRSSAFADGNVKISDMTSVGKGACVDQFTVELASK